MEVDDRDHEDEGLKYGNESDLKIKVNLPQERRTQINGKRGQIKNRNDGRS